MREFYNLSPEKFEEVKQLASSPRKLYFTDAFRKKLENLKVNAIIIRTMMKYDRYRECESIYNFLIKHNIKLKGLDILDFGCGVGDYGIFMARKGAKVTFCDFPELINFAKFRCQRENLSCQTIFAPIQELQKEFDFIIFGEVLEHLNNPLGLLKSIQGTNLIFTSAYPFKSKKSFDDPGHLKNAFLQQTKCLNLLNKNYTCHTLNNVAKMWINKHNPIH